MVLIRSRPGTWNRGLARKDKEPEFISGGVYEARGLFLFSWKVGF